MNNITYNTVKLTDNHINVIALALEVYYRLNSGQIGIALDTTYSYKLDRETVDLVEDMIKRKIFPELNHRGSAYGFNSPQIGNARIAYEIRKVLEEYIAVKKNDGYYGYTVNFDGPLKASDEPFPFVVEHKNYKDFNVPEAESDFILKCIADKDYEQMWDHIDNLDLNIPKGEKTEVIPAGHFVIIRVTKPRK